MEKRKRFFRPTPTIHLRAMQRWRDVVNTHTNFLELIQFIPTAQAVFSVLWLLLRGLSSLFPRLQPLLFRPSPFFVLTIYIYILIVLSVLLVSTVYLSMTEYRGSAFFIPLALGLLTVFLFYFHTWFVSFLETGNHVFDEILQPLFRLFVFSISHVILLNAITFPFLESSGEKFNEPLSEDLPDHWK